MSQQRHLCLVAILCVFGIALSATSLFWDSLWRSYPIAKAIAPVNRINIPYFTSAVPFNQTAILWFGDIASTDNYVDVRIGYNSSELYIDLQIVDRYLWYDPKTNAPDLANGDNATIYLSAAPGNAIDQHAYKFQAGANGYVQRNNYQVAFTGKSGSWTAASIPFTANFGWRGQGFNGPEDKGWSMTYHIPFTSLGLSAAPLQGTFWQLAIRVHNRDDAANTPIPDKWWPTTGGDTDTSTWGKVSFGMPMYQPPTTSNNASFTIRNHLNNQIVTDAMVGGSLNCGSNVADVWSQLGNTGYPGAVHVNIQNEEDISDWNCFSKFYITFPLSSLPQGKGIVNATITLYEYANSGVQGQPNPSYIQVATVSQDWNPATLSWNNAPEVQENINSIQVNTKSQPVIPWPGLAATWDVSRAVEEAYTSSQPLRLVFYSTDNQYNSGKYFISSEVGDWDANGRPTLQVSLGTITSAPVPVSSPTRPAASTPGHTPAAATATASASKTAIAQATDPAKLNSQSSSIPPAAAPIAGDWRWIYLVSISFVPVALFLFWKFRRRGPRTHT